MAAESYHVMPGLDGGWRVKKEGSHRAAKKFTTKKSAIEWAREVSRSESTELFIHKLDGRISDKVSYRKDPLPLKQW